MNQRAADRAPGLTNGALNRRAALASVAVALLLGTLKLIAVWRTGSIAMLGSLTDTGLDLVVSLVTLVAVRVAAQPADLDHRFGHGKAEALAALFQVSLISVAALAIIVRSVSRFSGGGQPESPEYGIIVSLIAIAVTLLLVWYQARIIAATGSIAIGADNIHYRSDLALNGSVILALVLDIYFHLHGADAAFGLAIGLWLGWNAWSTASNAINQLMDREWPVDKVEHFLKVASRHPELRGIHDLRTRTSGTDDFVQFHMWVDPKMTIAQAHEVMDEIEAKLLIEFPGIEILIHPDPEGHVDAGDPLAARDAREVVADVKAAEE